MEEEDISVQEGDVTMKAEVRVMGWLAVKMEEGTTSKEVQAASEAGTDKETDSPLSLQKEQPCQHLDLQPNEPCDFQNCEVVTLCRSRALSLWESLQ